MKYTPTYQIPYLEGSDKLSALSAASQEQALGVEAALLSQSVPPAGSDLISLITRMNALEAAISDYKIPNAWSDTVTLTNSFQDFVIPTGIFTDTPNLAFTILSASAGSIGATVMVSTRSATSFRARKAGGTNESIGFMVVAIQDPN